MTAPSPVYALKMVDQATLESFRRYAASVEVPGLKAYKATVALGERLDGDLITRVTLLVDDPQGDTWEVSVVRELRKTLGRRATDLGLPPVSLTLVPKREAHMVEVFAR
jgi:hypothetical protein